MFMFKLNLRMFDGNTNTTSDAGLSVEMKTYYEEKVIRKAGPNLVHEQVCVKRPIPQGSGKEIEFRYLDPLTENPDEVTLQEGVTPDGEKLNWNAFKSYLKQYGSFVQYSDWVKLTTLDPQLIMISEKQGQQSGIIRDKVIRNYLQAGTNVMYCPKVNGGSETEVIARYGIDASASLTVASVAKAVAIMEGNNVPKFGEDYIMIIHPYIKHALMRDPEWIDVSKYAGSTQIFKGEIGKVWGVRFLVSTNAKVYRGDDLSEASRNLTLASAASAATTLSVSQTLEANALKGRYVLIGTAHRKVTGNTTNSITVDAAVTAESGTTVYPGEGGAGGISVFASLLCGNECAGVSDLEGGGLEFIVKPLGSGDDPLNQRGTAGWKMSATAEILVDPYIMRVESASPAFVATPAN